jgi:hypothetical protein
VPGEILYFTTVRVASARAREWDEFYDDYARAFATEVPGVARGVRWSVTRALADGRERIDDGERPMFQAMFEHPNFADFILSRHYRATEPWKPRSSSFSGWYGALSEYATIHLHRIASSDSLDAPAPTPAVLSTLWTIDWEAVGDFDPAYSLTVERGFAGTLPGLVRVSRYVASLAHLHRYGDENGKLVIPQRHHFEERQTRLVYATFFELARLPDVSAQSRILGDLGDRLDRFKDEIADRLEAFAERRLVVERENSEGAVA